MVGVGKEGEGGVRREGEMVGVGREGEAGMRREGAGEDK